ncbi:transcription initiation factor IIB [Candidatus Bathyarchaeota archaeon]|nr:MAG: transcription initiation factor IIB [Candidatus Bathyarchaeota archaeon]
MGIFFVIKECSRCKGTAIVTDGETGETVCRGCGLVLNDNNFNMEPEWRDFSPGIDQSKSRVGMGASYAVFDKGLSTIFGGYRDSSGKPLKEETLHTMIRLRRYDNSSKVNESWRRNLSIAMGELDRMSNELHLPINLKERSAVLYRKVLKHELVKGRSIDAFVAACIHVAGRESGLPRQLKEIAYSSKRELCEVAKSYRFLIKEMGLRMPVDNPSKFVSKIASKLGVSMETECKSIDIIRSARNLNGTSGKNPMGVAAAALYMACLENDEKRAQKDVANAAGTTEVTLRNRLRDLEILFS